MTRPGTTPHRPPAAARARWGASWALLPALASPAALGAGCALVAAALLLHRPAVLQTAVAALLAAATAVLARALHATSRARAAACEVAAELAVALEAARDTGVRDEATGLLNRRGVLLVGGQVLEAARRSSGAVHCVVLEPVPAVPQAGRGAVPPDLEHLRRAALARSAVAAALSASTRAADVVASDEEGRFVVLGPGTGLPVQEVERRVRAALAAQEPARGAREPGLSDLALDVGTAVLAPWDEGDVPELLARAERALARRRALRRSGPPRGRGRRRTDV